MVQPTNRRIVTEASVGGHVATQLTTPGSAAAVALATALEGVAEPDRLPPLHNISKALTGPFRIMQVGTSIAAASTSAANMLTEQLKTVYGDSGLAQVRMGELGGSYNNVYSGWNKQVYGGPMYTRLRGSSTSTAISFNFYFDEVTFEWSRETDAQPVEILIDGVSVGTVGSGGAQAYSQKTTFTTTLGPHRITINPPASGYAYLEYASFKVAARKGVESRDAAMGGSMVRNMTELYGVTGSAVAGIPIVGDNGVNSYFDRSDVDLFIVSYVVNDAGHNDPNNVENVYKPTMQKIINKTAALGKPLVLIVEMAGHFIMANDAGSTYNNTKFNAIRDYLLSLRANSHVTVIDWHSATATADVAAYAARYYSGVGALNTAAGTYTGDFIHPTVAGHQVAQALIAQAVGLAPPISGTPAVIESARLTTLPPGLGMDKSATVDTVAKRYAVPSGPAFIALAPNSTKFAGRLGAYYRDTAAANRAAETGLTAEIAASVNSTEHGKYVDWATKALGLSFFVDWPAGVKTTLTMKASGTVEVRADSAIRLYVDGVIMPQDPANSNRTILKYTVSGTKPVVFSTTVGAPANGATLYVSGRVYDIALTKSDVPILT